MKVTKQKGTRDIYLDDIKIWQFVERNIREIANAYNLNEIRTPVFEATELFSRGVGEETDVVNKEMYTFLDKGGRSITLRPELTAGVVRSYIENGFDSYISPIKFWYMGNMYRYEKMQKGRYREFSQFGVEIFGSKSYKADLEAIIISSNFLDRIGLRGKYTLSINSIGCKKCREEYINKLKSYIKPNLSSMCDDCKKRYDKNPLRVLDCKVEKCQEILKDAPMILDNLCDDCKNSFNKVINSLEKLNINYKIDKKIVRGLDYYNGIVYEYTSDDLGLAIGGGGRYDTLVENLGGASTPAVGFGMGLNRVVLLLEDMKEKLKSYVDVYFLITNDEGYIKSLDVIKKLRENGYKIEQDLSEKSFRAQLKYADKIKARYVIILGEDEIKNNKCILRNMENGSQKEICFNFDEIVDNI